MLHFNVEALLWVMDWGLLLLHSPYSLINREKIKEWKRKEERVAHFYPTPPHPSSSSSSSPFASLNLSLYSVAHTLSAPRLINPSSSWGQTFKPWLGNLHLKHTHSLAHTHNPHPIQTSHYLWSGPPPPLTLLQASIFTITQPSIIISTRTDCFHMGTSNTWSIHIYKCIHTSLYVGLQLVIQMFLIEPQQNQVLSNEMVSSH